MSNPESPTFSSTEAFAARDAMRTELNLGPETFGAQDLVRMIGDEIAGYRKAGRTDEEIVGAIAKATGKRVPVDMIAAAGHDEGR